MQPNITVGILSASKLQFVFNEAYMVGNKPYVGKQTAVFENGEIGFHGELFDEITFFAKDDEASFDLIDVVIGIGFHWERKENQRFKGQLKLIVENDKLTAINILSVEEYLLSVISSEMSATSSPELLKAHAVISRSWLLAQIKSRNEKREMRSETEARDKKHISHSSSLIPELVKWYDKDDHENFDVCADDHCQRYQGITKVSSPFVYKAITATKGEVLLHKNEICDARFSKCCGGISELFENCWQPEHYDYLLPIEDKPNGKVRTEKMSEQVLESFINSPAEGDFCNTKEAKILRQVLNDYDQETSDFYRWEVLYSQGEISALLFQKTGIDFGEIIDLIPVERGVSGRLVKLKIVGTKRSMIIGKELEIRKALSSSHLYSSAFLIEKNNIQNTIPQQFVLRGAGWGHGVGLCQIGAAVMAEKGYTYQEILAHYFKNTQLKVIY